MKLSKPIFIFFVNIDLKNPIGEEWISKVEENSEWNLIALR